MTEWTLARWREWLGDHPDEVNTPYHDDNAADSEFRCHNTLLHLAVLGHWASEMGVRPSEFVALLLSNGADPNAQNDEGATPLHLACELDTLSARNVEQLLAGGADPAVKDKQGEIPFDRLFGQKEATRQIREMLERAMKDKQ